MAGPYAPLGVPQMPQLTPEELELLRQQLAQEAMAPQRVPRPGDPGLPPQGQAIATSQNPPQADAIAGALGLPPQIASALGLVQQAGEMGPRAVQGAEQAIGQASRDPSIENLSRATARSAMVPLAASPFGRVPLGFAGAGMGAQMADAARRDLGIGDTAAQAGSLTQGQQRRMEMERMRAEEARKGTKERIETETRAATEREEATRKGEVAAEAARKDREIYDAKIKTARERRAVELGRQKQFADTALGQTFTEYGSAAPWLAGGAAGGLTRAATQGYSLAKPIIAGGLAGAGVGNWPLISDAAITPPVLNPEREGAEKYAIEAPESDPDRPRMEQLARDLPRANPIRTQAREELIGPYGSSLAGRTAMTGAEGALGSEMAYNAMHGLSRLRNLFGGGGRPPAAPLSPAPLPPAAQAQGPRRVWRPGGPGGGGRWENIP